MTLVEAVQAIRSRQASRQKPSDTSFARRAVRVVPRYLVPSDAEQTAEAVTWTDHQETSWAERLRGLDWQREPLLVMFSGARGAEELAGKLSRWRPHLNESLLPDLEELVAEAVREERDRIPPKFDGAQILEVLASFAQGGLDGEGASDFVLRYGAPEICRHGELWNHEPRTETARRERRGALCKASPFGAPGDVPDVTGRWSIRLEDLQRIAVGFTSLDELVRALQADVAPPQVERLWDDVWHRLRIQGGDVSRAIKSSHRLSARDRARLWRFWDARQQRAELAGVLDELLAAVDVRLNFSWNGVHGTGLQVPVRGPLAVTAMEICRRAAGESKICEVCDLPFEAKHPQTKICSKECLKEKRAEKARIAYATERADES